MRKWLLIVLLAVVLIITGVTIVNRFNEDEGKDKTSAIIITESKIEHFLEEDEAVKPYLAKVQKSPEQVVRLNALLRKMMYAKETPDNQLESLLRIQRQLYAPELIKKNRMDVNFIRLKKEIERWHETKTAILSYETQGVKYIGQVSYGGVKKETAFVDAVLYTNKKDVDIYVTYVLYLDTDDTWKIYGWQKGEEFLKVG